ncbi:MAG: hypothetical protein NVSMB23_07880 [Myxococcales bacterium]
MSILVALLLAAAPSDSPRAAAEAVLRQGDVTRAEKMLREVTARDPNDASPGAT